MRLQGLEAEPGKSLAGLTVGKCQHSWAYIAVFIVKSPSARPSLNEEDTCKSFTCKSKCKKQKPNTSSKHLTTNSNT